LQGGGPEVAAGAADAEVAPPRNYFVEINVPLSNSCFILGITLYD
jgi:hypothetical protein